MPAPGAAAAVQQGGTRLDETQVALATESYGTAMAEAPIVNESAALSASEVMSSAADAPNADADDLSGNSDDTMSGMEVGSVDAVLMAMDDDDMDADDTLMEMEQNGDESLVGSTAGSSVDNVFVGGATEGADPVAELADISATAAGSGQAHAGNDTSFTADVDLQAEIATLAPTDEDIAGVLNLDGDDRITTDRIRSSLGREPLLADLPRLNINTQEGGRVFLRGYVFTEEQRQLVEQITGQTEGVGDIVNEIIVEPEGVSPEGMEREAGA
jgi:osmotically-inducible protein OsmY